MFRSSRAQFKYASWVLLLPACFGCRDGLQLAPASGTVTLDGQPLADAAVMFHPVAGGPVATGSTDAQGSFSLHTTNAPGALVGEHQVTIAKSVMHNIVDGMPGPGGATTEWVVPQRYASRETSGLTAEIKPRGTADLAFALQSHPSPCVALGR